MERQDKILEIFTSILLALASLVAAWSAYQASAWSSEQATMGQTTARHRLEATRAINRGDSCRSWTLWCSCGGWKRPGPTISR
jgi:hypothetical protein